ncbi:putative Sad1 / UNC-like C-terminal [Blattamonas nauphoetae]|uniref:Sad1 / UNC-like C-terminal n=1 Tax=Blattamonas nauphoetae TaxID=2049346 RepID=A0ABQ9XF18_9EUKA|nr:putative Sad1 / UNC-like C-terminal [Blattamonas nauphoetae]
MMREEHESPIIETFVSSDHDLLQPSTNNSTSVMNRRLFLITGVVVGVALVAVTLVYVLVNNYQLKIQVNNLYTLLENNNSSSGLRDLLDTKRLLDLEKRQNSSHTTVLSLQDEQTNSSTQLQEQRRLITSLQAGQSSCTKDVSSVKKDITDINKTTKSLTTKFTNWETQFATYSGQVQSNFESLKQRISKLESARPQPAPNEPLTLANPAPDPALTKDLVLDITRTLFNDQNQPQLALSSVGARVTKYSPFFPVDRFNTYFRTDPSTNETIVRRVPKSAPILRKLFPSPSRQKILEKAQVILSTSLRQGDCFPLALPSPNSPSFVTIKLASPCFLHSVGIRHIPADVSLTAPPITAPKAFRVFCANSTDSAKDVFLGRGEYNATHTTIHNSTQRFAMNPLPDKPCQSFKVQFDSNHGDPDYTCLYNIELFPQFGER